MTDQLSSEDTPPADWAVLAGAPATAESLTALAGADPAALTGAALVDAIVASEKALSLLAGTQMRLMAALAVPFVAGDPMRLAAVLARKNCITRDDDPAQVAHFVPLAAASLASEEVAAALRIPCQTAGNRVAEADRMTGVLAPTLESLEEGVLDRVKARVIADHCKPLTPEQTKDLQDLVLPEAGALTTSELRDVTGQAVIIVDPDGAENRHQQAAAGRELRMQPQPDGMATLRAHLPADGAVKIFQVTDLLATGTAGTAGDTRRIGARRVDALVDIADHLLTHGFIDLTDYLGAELPDHGTTTPRARRANSGTASTSTASAETAGPGTASSAGTSTTETASTSTASAGTARPDTASSADTSTTETASTQQASADTGAPSPASTEPSGTADTTAGTEVSNSETESTSNAAVPGGGVSGSENATVTGDVGTTDPIDTDPPTNSTADSPIETGPPTNSTADSPIETDAPATGAADGPARVAPATGAASTDTGSPDSNSRDGDSADIPDTDMIDQAAEAEAAAATGAATSTAPAGKRRGGNRVFTRQGRRPHLSVTIGLSTLAGLDNLPGSLAGFGAIPAGLARSIALSAATINAVATDPDTGTVTAAGALTYRPTQELRDQIAAILNFCQFPSCRQPVWRCDMDHRDEFNHRHPEQGGKTTPENTGPFCRRHHLIKHHSDWRIRIDPNRTVLEFTSPTGHTYTKHGRQAAAPGLWVSTAATAIAERLDNIANPPSTLIRHADDEPTPTSHIEDLLAAILIRHHLNTTPVEIDYEPGTAWEHIDPDDEPPF